MPCEELNIKQLCVQSLVCNKLNYEQETAFECDGGVVYNEYLQGVIDQATIDGADIPDTAILDKLNARLEAIGATDLGSLDYLYFVDYLGTDVFKAYNFIDPTVSGSVNGGASWGANGVVGSGTTGYFDTGYAPNAMPNVTVNSASFGAFMYDVPVLDKAAFGSYENSPQNHTFYRIKNLTTLEYAPCYASGSTISGIAKPSGSTEECYQVDMDTGTGEVWVNGVSMDSQAAAVSSALSPFNMYVLARNNNGSTNLAGANTFRAAWGGGLIDALNIRNAINDNL